MIAACIYLHIKPEMIDDFIRVSTDNHNKSVKEPGNIRFDIIQQVDDATRFMLYEAYETEEQATAHKNTPQYFAWRDAVKDMMQEPRYGIKYNILQPTKK
ncbi:MAG TPA: antibiotic biosynthesis monooxygenase [Bacteroidales bacterium]|nr:antibiotic biosynthesis monooxygenase [Bacteroidales bacterium]